MVLFTKKNSLSIKNRENVAVLFKEKIMNFYQENRENVAVLSTEKNYQFFFDRERLDAVLRMLKLLLLLGLESFPQVVKMSHL